MAAILKIDMTSYFGNECSDLDEIRQPDAEQHANYSKMVEIETGSSIEPPPRPSLKIDYDVIFLQ